MSEEVELMLLADVRSLEITLASKSRHLAEAQAKAAEAARLRANDPHEAKRGHEAHRQNVY